MRSPLLVLIAASLALACQSPEPAFRGVGARHRRDAPVATPVAPAPVAPAPVAPPAPVVAPVPVTGEPSRDGWNEAQIDWLPYEQGLVQARQTGRPVCLVFSATWCSHCRTYSHVFEDPRVVAASRDFVMIHVDSDAQREVAAQYMVDGGYVPRTYFLDADATTMTSVVARTDRFRYFFDENDPASLLSGMTRARSLHGS